MTRSSFLFLLLICCAVPYLQAQPDPNPELASISWKRKFNHAESLFAQHDFYNAIDFYKLVIQDKPGHIPSALKIAACNEKLRDYDATAWWYGYLLERQPAAHPEAWFYLGKAQKNLEKYAEARASFEKFEQLAKSSADPVVFDKLFKELESQKAFLGQIQGQQPGTPKALVKKVDAPVNGPFSDFAPMETQDGLFLYSAIKTEAPVQLSATDVPSVFSAIYFTKDGQEGVFLKDDSAHLAYGRISPDGQEMFFSRCSPAGNKGGPCKIYRVKLAGGFVMGEPVEVGGIHSDSATFTHPFPVRLRDGKKVLFFVSDRKGGYGGLDIWYTFLDNEGNGSLPENAGSLINTPGDEVSPFYDPNSRSLYFSSDRHPGYGGLDVFSATGEPGKFSSPVNLGANINGGADEFDYFPVNAAKGFFTSNRPSSQSLKGATCCDNIYRYEVNQIFVKVKGTASEDRGYDQVPLTEAKAGIYLTGTDSLLASVEVTRGRFAFSAIPGGFAYDVRINKEGFKPASAQADLRKFTASDSLTLQPLVLRPVDADRGFLVASLPLEKLSSGCDASVNETLNNLIKFSTTNYSLKLEISAHHPEGVNSATDAALQTLQKYLVEQGLDAQRFVVRNYGAQFKPTIPVAEFRVKGKAGE